MDKDLRAQLRAIEERLQAIEAAIEARGTPEQVQQMLRDVLNIYSATGQTAEVVKIHAEQLQAFADAYTRLSVAVKTHDDTSGRERAEIKDLMSAMHLLLGSLLAVVRSQMRHLNDIGHAVGADQAEAELRRIQDVETRDARPEEK